MGGTSPPGPDETAASRSDVGSFKCEKCGTPFPSEQVLQEHMQQAHKD